MKSAGPAKIELIGNDGKVVSSVTRDFNRGYNELMFDLRLSPEKEIPKGSKRPADGKEAVRDPFESSRATFVPKGEYKVRITQGDKKAEKAWKLD